MNFPTESLLTSSTRRIVHVVFFVALSTLTLLQMAGAENTDKKTTPGEPPDILVFTNGDQLTGKFLRMVDDNVTFHSNMAGDVTVPFKNVKELRSSRQFAVLYKKQKVNRKTVERDIPLGTVSIKDEIVQVSPQGRPQPQAIPYSNVADIIDSQTFLDEVRHEPSIFSKWVGTFTLGSADVQATQNNTSFSGGVALIRVIPSVTYLPTRNRTTINFSGSYGKLTEPGFPDVKTAIYHADSERDQYFSQRFYGLGQVSFDHNFSQSLDLQQIYGGGIGATVLKKARQQLDLKGTIQYEKQTFLQATAGTNQDLIGSTFSGTYLLKLPMGMIYTQQASYIPAWNHPRAYSANETNSLAIPLYKNLSLTVGTIDSYLNDPAVTVPPTKRNSFQFTTGVSYTLR